MIGIGTRIDQLGLAVQSDHLHCAGRLARGRRAVEAWLRVQCAPGRVYHRSAGRIAPTSSKTHLHEMRVTVLTR